jgi:predicted ATPase
MSGVQHPVIRTPDQRIRVFVSSTLRELADERRAARTAIERMRLAPVMFELGARPHPPRELYRSYLEQSDVFVGIYWQSYGWVAPDEDVSGLEDEYNLAPATMPKLIYIKAADQRDERLQELLGRIRDDDTAAYLTFETAEELGDRLGDDLATLFAERFDQSRTGPIEVQAEESGVSPAARVPQPGTPTIGREQDIAAVRGLLAQGIDRVVTLAGPGGIGKSRLAIEAARASADLFPDGVYFVPLEAVLDEDLLLPAIAAGLGIRDSGEAALLERLAGALDDRRVLIVLDNFEQIVDAAPLLVKLFSIAPQASFLVTSRIVLRIRGERVYEVEPLTTPPGDLPASLHRATRSSAVALFVSRAQAVKPGFDITAENAADVADICRRLEGLPLAIELAAARVRLLTPSGIAERLGQSLPLLTAAARDLPERHRTMKATIDWSVGLLPEVERDLLEDLGVFVSRFSFEAVEALGAGRSWDGLALEALGALVDGSLVRQTDVDGRVSFSLLALVREYSMGRLKERGDADLMRTKHADYFASFVRGLAPELRGKGQMDAVMQLELELPNIRAAVRHLIYTDRLDDAADAAWGLLIYWWLSGSFAEVRLWMLELLGKDQPLAPRTRAAATFFVLWGELWQHPSDQMVSGLGECVRLFTESGDEESAAMAMAGRATTRMQFPDLDVPAAIGELNEAVATLRRLGNTWGEAIGEVSLGRLMWALGQIVEALQHFDRATEIAQAGQDLFTLVVAGSLRSRLNFLRGEVEAAEAEFEQILRLSTRLHFEEGIAYGLEGLCAVAAIRGESWRAGALSAAATQIRHRIGVFDVEAFTVHPLPLAALRERDPEGLAAGERAGVDLELTEAIALALPEDDSASREPLAQS